MNKSIFFLLVSLCFAPAAFAQDANESEPNKADETAVAEVTASADEAPAVEPGGPKTMSGMSILGNEETPKSLVIVPWKSSEMGDEMSLSDTLDERAQPVDKEVFLRELSFYQIRSNEQ
jgi:hypothetical protein